MATKTIAPALKALLEGLIDYAGIFPPAKLPLKAAVNSYSGYKNSEYSWMLRNFVVSASELSNVPKELDGALAVLGEADNTRAASIESKGVVSASHPVYCEVSLGKLEELDVIQQAKCFAKIRTGGIKPDAIPSTEEVEKFINACAERRLAFKATAGLHHPIRAIQPLTYEQDAPRAYMHGFINVLMSAAFSWHGEKRIEPILADLEPNAFAFDDRAHWRHQSLSIAEIEAARTQFMHSIGSCSFDEPIHDLKALGWV